MKRHLFSKRQLAAVLFMLDEEEKNAALSDKKKRHYASYLTCHTIPHIYAPVLLIFHPFLKTKIGSYRRKCCGGDVRLFTVSESSRHR
jgi:hypothetical protein